MKRYYILSIIMFLCVLTLAACGGKKTIGTPAPVDAAPVPLTKILDEPAAYDGKTVVLRGILTGQCSSLCDFTYTEGRQSVTVYMSDPKPPRIKAGQPVRVTVTVHKGERQVIITATGLELLPSKGAP